MSDAAPVPRSYLPGEWYAVLGPSLVLALPPDRRDLAARAWTAVDAGADADELLDLVLASGLRDLAGLALVSTAGARTRALVRGHAVCLLLAGGRESVADGRGSSTWAEVVVEDVEAVSLELGRAADGEPLTVGDGLVRASRVLWPAERPTGPASYAGDRLEPASALAEPTAAPVIAAEAVRAPAAGPEPLPDLAPSHDPDAVDGPDADGNPDPDGDASDGLAPREDPVPMSDPGWAEDDVETGPVAGAPVPPVPPVPSPWAPGAGDHDGRTQDGSWGADLVREPHAVPGQIPAPGVTAGPVAVLELSTGERVEVDRVVVLGRAPEARRFTATQQPRLVTVPSPQQEISSTHLEVRPGSGADHGSAVVTDLGSTNGTVLVQPGLPPESLRPGIAVQLLPGAVIDLGDGFSIVVARP